MSDGQSSTALGPKRELPPEFRASMFKPGPDARRGPGANAVAKEVRDLAKAAAPDAIRTLINLVATGSAAVRVQAAKAVLGIAGVPLQPSLNVKHSHELSPAPASVSVRDLIALVRASSASGLGPPVGAMPRLEAGPVSPGAAPDGAVGARSRPLTGPDGAIEADYREITGESSSPASYDASRAPCTSGSQPEVLEGQVGEKTEDSSRG